MPTGAGRDEDGNYWGVGRGVGPNPHVRPLLTPIGAAGLDHRRRLHHHSVCRK